MCSRSTICNKVSAQRSLLIYDGRCQFCCNSVHTIKRLDKRGRIEFLDYHSFDDPRDIHPQLTAEMVQSRLHLIDPDRKIFAGFFAIRRICFIIPILIPFIPILYFPGMIIVGPFVYAVVAKNRYLFHGNSGCKDNSCFR